MEYALLDYVSDAGWTQLSLDEQDQWLGAYQAYLEAMVAAGILTTTIGLQPAVAATTVRVASGTTQVLDGPYADSKEQLGGLHIIEVPDLATAVAWATRSPTVRHGVVEVRPLVVGTLLTSDRATFLSPERSAAPGPAAAEA